VLAFNILYGVLVAVGLSVADLLVRVARPHDAIQGLVPSLAGMHDVDDYPQAQTIPGLVVYRHDASLFFANAEDFRRRALAAADRQPGPVRWFVLNVEANVEVDFTALEAVDAVREEITRRGAVFALARVKQDLLARLESFGLAEKVGPDRLFPTLPTAVAPTRTGPASTPARPGPGRYRRQLNHARGASRCPSGTPGAPGPCPAARAGQHARSGDRTARQDSVCPVTARAHGLRGIWSTGG
jgi:SulP family sulfate permease